MENIGTWSTEVEIFCTSHLLRTDIFVYSQNGLNWDWLKYSGTFIDATYPVEKTAIYLQNTNRDHYDVVCNIRSTVASINMATENIYNQQQLCSASNSKESLKSMKKNLPVKQNKSTTEKETQATKMASVLKKYFQDQERKDGHFHKNQ